MNIKSKLREYNVSYNSMFCIFMIGSILGFILEGIWHIIRKGSWESHSATVWGPFCIIYGIAAAVLYVGAIFLKDKNILLQFAVCAFAGSFIEYFSSLFQEFCFGSVSWNYSKQFFNIGGRISLRMTILWGILGVAFVRILFPLIVSLLDLINKDKWNVYCICLSVFMGINLFLTSIAVLRWGERIGNPVDTPSNAVEAFLDERFDDERMSETFPNMVFKDK
ncbi:MAG: putative ABC transporter permease [Clostridia bacterium]|nr:putative ABC transporter permease [Clostridia bacterium]